MKTFISYKMKNYYLACLILFFLTSCLVHPGNNQIDQTQTSLPKETQSQTSTSDLMVTPNFEDIIIPLEGPLLLINDNSSNDNPLFLLDISTAKPYPVDITPNASITSLGNALSPDKRSIVLVQKGEDDPFKKDLLIYDILTGKISHKIHVEASFSFDPEEMYTLFPEAVKREFSKRNFSSWILNESLAGSLGIFRWSANSRFLYYSNSCEGGYSCLYRYDLATKQVSQLEREMFFLEGFSPSPDESNLLIIKSPVPQLPDFHQVNVFVVDPSHNVTHIPSLSLDLNLTYEYSWLDNQSLAITGFNIEYFTYSEIYQYSLNHKEFLLLANEPFSDFIFTNNGIFTMKFDQDSHTTRVYIGLKEDQNKVLNLTGECSNLIRAFIAEYAIMVSCEQGLIGISPSYVPIKVTEISGDFTISPDTQFLIQYGSSDLLEGKDSIRLLDANFTLLREITVLDVRQIIWQPDSQGFLYLSMQGLFKVKLPDGEPELLIRNNSNDYRHLDAVWFYTNQSQ